MPQEIWEVIKKTYFTKEQSRIHTRLMNNVKLIPGKNMKYTKNGRGEQ